MDILTTFLIATCFGSTWSALSDWTVLLWLRSDENVEPAIVWSDSSSTYNSGTSTTLSTLFGSNRAGYRNTIIDTWSNNPPDRIKITYRNNEGASMYEAVFNTTDMTSGSWFNETKSISGLKDAWLTQQFMSYDSHNASFVVYDTSWGAQRYVAASITLHNGTVMYIIGNKQQPALLPANNSGAGGCYPSVGTTNPFNKNITTTNLTHRYCSAICRERNYLYGAVHNTICSCLLGNEADLTTPLTACVTPCEGDVTEMCGATMAPDIIAFNHVNTGIDTSEFDQPLQAQGTLQVTGALEVWYSNPKFIYGFNISIAVTNLPVTIDMYLYHRNEQCNTSTLTNDTLIKTFTMTDTDPFVVLDLEPIVTQCYYIYLYESTTTLPITFQVDMKPIILKGYATFATAQIMTIEAAWLVADTCECECWLYDLLYGESPFNNMTYEDIEDALKNVTDKIVKELTVNVSTLSSTLRKKTSADDARESATAIGYTLGVAILVSTLVAILLADIPKIIAGMKVIHKSLCSQPSTEPKPTK